MSTRVKCVLTLEEIDDIQGDAVVIFKVRKYAASSSEFSVTPREVLEQFIDTTTTEVNGAAWRRLDVLKGKKKR